MLEFDDLTTNQQIHELAYVIDELRKEAKLLTGLMANKKAAQYMNYTLECLEKAYRYLCTAHTLENNIIPE